MISPYLSDMIKDHKTEGEWKIQLIMSINFMSSKDYYLYSYYTYQES